MILPNWLYDILKWLALLCLPAFKNAIPRLFEIWGWPLGQQIADTLDVVQVVLGALLGLSCATYKAEPQATVSYDPEAVEHHIEEDINDSVE